MQILRYGSVGPQVSLAQLGLRRSGYLADAPDGIFGSVTRSAVQAFQKSMELPGDGVVGPRTWNALEPWLTGSRKVAVRQGDSFYRLAQRYGISVRRLEAANPEADPLNLRPGQKLTVPLPFPVVPGDVPFSSTVLRYCVRGLQARYPFISVGSVGSSVRGTPLRLLQIGRGARKVLYTGAHHANEWITAVLLMQYLERYAEALVLEGEIGGFPALAVSASAALSLVPMVDPDGVDLVTGELGPGTQAYFSALSMNGAAEGFPRNWKANIRGVDLNLQYPAGWEEAKRIKFAQGYTAPGPRDYVGPEPLSEPESRALYAFTRRLDPCLVLAYHTQGEVIYWKYLDREPPGARELAGEFSRLSGYAPENTPEGSAYAGYKDWFILEYDRPGFTIEAGRGTNPLPLSQLPEMLGSNTGILTCGQMSAAVSCSAEREQSGDHMK